MDSSGLRMAHQPEFSQARRMLLMNAAYGAEEDILFLTSSKN